MTATMLQLLRPLLFCGFGVDDGICAVALHTLLQAVLAETGVFSGAAACCCGTTQSFALGFARGLVWETLSTRILMRVPKPIPVPKSVDFYIHPNLVGQGHHPL